jgi:deazaflavin-dependent oxidoreductase (nitroreductase family)
MSSKPDRPQIPSDMRAFNKKIIEEFRANRGQLSGPVAGRPLMLLTTTGARSGEKRTVVLGFRTDGDRYMAIASDNGSDAPPAWFVNLLANPVATVEIGPEKFQVRASVAGAVEKARLAPRIEYLAGQQALTSREIPIVVFERIQAPPPA